MTSLLKPSSFVGGESNIQEACVADDAFTDGLLLPPSTLLIAANAKSVPPLFLLTTVVDAAVDAEAILVLAIEGSGLSVLFPFSSPSAPGSSCCGCGVVPSDDDDVGMAEYRDSLFSKLFLDLVLLVPSPKTIRNSILDEDANPCANGTTANAAVEISKNVLLTVLIIVLVSMC